MVMMLDFAHAPGFIPQRTDTRPPGVLRQNRAHHPSPHENTALDDVTLRPLNQSSVVDRALALTILREYFATVGGDDAVRRYRWLYEGNPHGRARTYAAMSKKTGVPVAITSLFPRVVQVGDRLVTGAIGGDAFVTPGFRRRGLATALHRLALAGMDDGLAFMFGPPEPNNLRALLQAGAKLTGAVRRYTRPIRLRPFGSLMRHRIAPTVSRWIAPGPSKLHIDWVEDRPDPRIDAIWRRVADDAADRGSVVPMRDATFYAWRFGRSVTRKQHPAVILDGAEPIAAAAVERRGPRAAIVDVTAAPRDLRRVLAALVYACRDADAVDLQIHVPSRRKEAVLASLGFVPRTKKPFQVQALPSADEFVLVTRPDAWDYTWGDGDVDHVL